MKLGDYQFTIGTKKDLSLADVLNQIQIILNNGRYQMRVITTVPDWTGDDGEHLLYVNGTTRRFYTYDATNGTWDYIEWKGTQGQFVGDRILDDAGTTGIFTQYIAAEKTLRFYIDGVYRMSLNASGLSIDADFPVSINGLNGNTYFKYNSTSGYWEFYVGGNLRMQF